MTKARRVAIRAGMALGRGDRNEIQVSDKTVGTHQLRIVALDDGRLAVEDCGSTNSTRLPRGRKLGAGDRVPLEHGLKLQAGALLITVERLTEDDATQPHTGGIPDASGTTDDPTFRSFWYGPNKLLLNTLFFGQIVSRTGE